MEVCNLNTITKTFDGLERVIKAVCSVLVVGFTGMTLIQVIARYVLSAPIWWSEQFCRYLFIWMLMLYAPVIIRHGQNLGFDLFVKRLPKKAQDILLLVCEILIGAFGGCYAFYSIQLCEKFANKIMEGIRLPAPVK